MDDHYPDDETVLLNYTMETEDDELALLNYAMEYPEESDGNYIYDGYGPAFILADE
jgi:hypothetical protein